MTEQPPPFPAPIVYPYDVRSGPNTLSVFTLRLRALSTVPYRYDVEAIYQHIASRPDGALITCDFQARGMSVGLIHGHKLRAILQAAVGFGIAWNIEQPPGEPALPAVIASHLLSSLRPSQQTMLAGAQITLRSTPTMRALASASSLQIGVYVDRPDFEVVRLDLGPICTTRPHSTATLPLVSVERAVDTPPFWRPPDVPVHPFCFGDGQPLE